MTVFHQPVDWDFRGQLLKPSHFPGTSWWDCDFHFIQTHYIGPLEGTLHMSFNTRPCLCFRHEDAPPHYNCEVRQWLFENYSGRWSCRGHGVPVSSTACSHDSNPADFSL